MVKFGARSVQGSLRRHPRNIAQSGLVMPHEIVADTTFPSDYEFELLEGWPAKSEFPNEYIFKCGSGAGSEFMALRVSSPDSATWLGVFQQEYGTPPAISRVYTCPKRTDLCVISGGKGYVIDIRDPNKYQELRCFPVTSAITSLQTKQIVFADFTRLLCLDEFGIRWISESACWDEAKIIGIDGGQVRCSGWAYYDILFNVDLQTGEISDSRPKA